MRGPKPKLTAAECTDLKEIYAGPNQTRTSVGKLFRVSPSTVDKVLAGTYTPRDEKPETDENAHD